MNTQLTVPVKQIEPLNKIREYVMRYFYALRKKQNQNRDLTLLTEDILFVIRFVNESVSHPVSELYSMGIVILKSYICFNITVLQEILHINQKQKIISSLQVDNWNRATTDIYALLSKIIGENDAKNYFIYELPEKSDIYLYIHENPRLLATQMSINMKSTPLIPPHQITTYFPLVSIQYERENEFFNIFDFDPKAAKTDSLKKNLVLEEPKLLFVRDEFKPK